MHKHEFNLFFPHPVESLCYLRRRNWIYSGFAWVSGEWSGAGFEVREEENNAIINAIDFKSHGLSASAKPRRSPTREQDPYLLSIYLIFVQFPKDTAQVRKYIVYGYLLT